jgi:biopolymer transport protein ExbB
MWEIILAGVEWPTYFIVAGSFAAIALIVEHFIVIRKAAIAPASQVKQTRELIESRDFRGCMQLLRESKTYFARTMTSALSHARHGFDAMHDAAIEKSGELSGGMFRKVEYLSILGNLGPLMGLLGTVLGMIHAFGAMGSTGGDWRREPACNRHQPGAGQHDAGTGAGNHRLGIFRCLP